MQDLSTPNSTVSSLPSALMDATIPGYGIISQIVFRLFGIDIGLAISGFLIIFALLQGVHFLFKCAYDYFLEHLTSTIEIDDDDDLYRQVLTWIAEQRMTKISQSLRAVSYCADDQNDGDKASELEVEDVLDDKGIFNFEKWAGNIPPRYEPNFGTDRFCYNGRTFYYLRQKLENKRNMYVQGFDQSLTIRCIGRSTQPIKNLLAHIKNWILSRENKMTSVFRPATKEDYRAGTWTRQSCRPSRPIDTVSLDQKQTAKIIQDINEYLHPATARWYAARGIPYRRGYLFHGPPGTGKTSLSFALAGIFGVGIYVISLSEVGLTESDLGGLFSILPKRCILLLEDIDSAGLRREDDQASTIPSSGVPSIDSDSDLGITSTSKNLEGMRKMKAGSKNKSLISLAGLLNIIDGAASQEGRVLIMSTNYPEKLDAALIRPGRIDLQVHFTLAKHGQIRDIFMRMYTTQADESNYNSIRNIKNRAAKQIPQQKHDIVSKPVDKVPNSLACESTKDDLGPGKVAEMADEFANQFPEDTFSPAEIQGYLLVKKSDPNGALNEAGGWRDVMIKAKRDREKVASAH
ncbi:BCS1 N terminal-domain-containing protein [Phaeosphaeriaceae sp. PMI808]|nr:BCS1 N terminal-domain-containing protein [Phaeosphaeriaceae sp. PMI808]